VSALLPGFVGREALFRVPRLTPAAKYGYFVDADKWNSSAFKIP
jgi:hypothetical protein